MMKPSRASVSFISSAKLPAQYPRALKKEIVFVGRSNVGKSSLLNALFGNRSLARVSGTPGKTRLLNFFAWEDCLLVDVPGYGFAHGPREDRDAWQAMMEAYFAAKRPLALVLLLVDGRHDPSPLDITMADYLETRAIPYCVALTKWDCLSQAEKSAQTRAFEALWPQIPRIPVSAKTRFGIDALWKVLYAHCRT